MHPKPNPDPNHQVHEEDAAALHDLTPVLDALNALNLANTQLSQGEFDEFPNFLNSKGHKSGFFP